MINLLLSLPQSVLRVTTAPTVGSGVGVCTACHVTASLVPVGVRRDTTVTSVTEVSMGDSFLGLKGHIPLKKRDPTQMKSTPKIRNVHSQRDNFAFGAQSNLYSTDSHLSFV